MVSCSFFRRCAPLAAATIVTACAQSSSKTILPTAAGQWPALTPSAAAHLYIARFDSLKAIVEYPIQNGIPQANPDRTLEGLGGPIAINLDAAGNLYVLDNVAFHKQVLKEFAPGASGYARPIRTIDTPDGNNIGSLAIDSGGYIYVGQNARIFVYAPAAHGHAKPVATRRPKGYPSAVAVEPPGDLYELGSSQENQPRRTFQTQVSVYSGEPSVQLLRHFCGYEESALGIDFGVALDGLGNLFTAHTYFAGSSYPLGAVHVFPQNDTACPSAPRQKITTNPALHEPVYLAVSAPYLYVYDLWYGNGGVVFTLKTTGSPQTPLSTLYVDNNQPHNIQDMALGP
ncbi:MAG: hypothetical protein JO324_00900 [Candidatus Eremiobacteraeota bacterium]|nr:hypothetical protein [Candidatus Eremiobacteraeota bacterium]